MHSHFESNAASVAARALKDPENRSIEIGIVCTLLFHLLLLVVAPRLPVEMLHGSLIGARGTTGSPGREFNIELSPDLVAPQPQADPFRFVETNPDAPANEPDRTANFSNRTQQTAQEEAAKEIDAQNRPSVRGEDLFPNDASIVSGDAARPQAGTYVISTAAADAQAAEASREARAEQVPLSGTDRVIGESPDSIGTNISESKAASNNAEQFVEGVREARSPTGGLTATPEASPRAPAPRPRLSQARPTILQNRITGTANIGALGIDAKWSEFGDYMQELIDIVDAQWRNLLNARSVRPPTGTHAIVTFKLNARGLVEIVSVEETCGTPGTYVSLSAIQDRQPYRKWTAPMVAVLGEEQTITFGFYFR